MSLTQALRHDIERWPGNQESLSHALFSAPRTLSHKLAGAKRMAIGLEEAVDLMLLTGGRETICEAARELGGVFIQLPKSDQDVDNEELHTALRKLTNQIANLVNEIDRALADDNQIDEVEQQRITRAQHELTVASLRYAVLMFRFYGTPAVASSTYRDER